MNNHMTSDINFRIGLDENRIPETLTWSAQDGGVVNEEAKAIMLSIWNSKNKESLRIDLWTKDMPVDEMKIFIYQSLLAMADTFQRASNDEKMSESIRDFSEYFAEQTKIKK